MTLTLPGFQIDPSSPKVILITVLVALLSTTLVMPLFKNHFKPAGKIAYVTGGSTGMGLALAHRLLKEGISTVIIVARSQANLDAAQAALEATATGDQKVYTISADLTTSTASHEAWDRAIELCGGRVPEYAFLVAGMSKPKYFIDSDEEHLQRCFDSSYWIQAWTAHAVCKSMIAHRVKGSIVFTSSFLGFTSFVGYSSYSPGKYALRGLADSLRNEMLIHDINVHIFSPAGIDSPGHVTEEEFKPNPTKKLEEGDELLKPDAVVGHLIRGLQRGYYQPTSYFITDLIRVHARGGVPNNNPFIDYMWLFLGAIGMPIWVFFMDKVTKGFKKEVEADLEAKGYYVKSAQSKD